MPPNRQIQMAADQFGKSLLRISVSVVLQQFQVACHRFQYIVAAPESDNIIGGRALAPFTFAGWSRILGAA